MRLNNGNEFSKQRIIYFGHYSVTKYNRSTSQIILQILQHPVHCAVESESHKISLLLAYCNTTFLKFFIVLPEIGCVTTWPHEQKRKHKHYESMGA